MSQYKAGEVLLTSKPFAFVIFSKHRSLICSYCWSRLVKSSSAKCEECGLVRYCGEKCKVAGEEEHEEECRAMGGVELSDQLRLLARIWLKLRKEGINIVEHHGSMSKSWTDLVDHADDWMMESEKLLVEQYNELGLALKEEDMPTMETFVEIFGKILTNSFSIRSDRYSSPGPIGNGVYLLASMFDHSCTPNCTVVFQGRNMAVMALEDIPVGDITSVAFISYINTLDNTKTRQMQQKAVWFFTCSCSLCQDIRIDRQKHSIKCTRCGKGRPVDTVRWKVYGPCTNCCYRNPKEDTVQVARYKELYQIIAETEPDGEGTTSMGYDELCEWCVGEMADVISTEDILHVNTLHYVHTVCISNKRWREAIRHGEMALPAFKAYYGARTGAVAALQVRLGKAYGELGEIEKSEYHFKEADSIYRVVPGSQHPFYVDDFRPLFAKYVET